MFFVRSISMTQNSRCASIGAAQRSVLAQMGPRERESGRIRSLLIASSAARLLWLPVLHGSSRTVTETETGRKLPALRLIWPAKLRTLRESRKKRARATLNSCPLSFFGRFLLPTASVASRRRADVERVLPTSSFLFPLPLSLLRRSSSWPNVFVLLLMSFQPFARDPFKRFADKLQDVLCVSVPHATSVEALKQTLHLAPACFMFAILHSFNFRTQHRADGRTSAVARRLPYKANELVAEKFALLFWRTFLDRVWRWRS